MPNGQESTYHGTGRYSQAYRIPAVIFLLRVQNQHQDTMMMIDKWPGRVPLQSLGALMHPSLHAGEGKHGIRGIGLRARLGKKATARIVGLNYNF